MRQLDGALGGTRAVGSPVHSLAIESGYVWWFDPSDDVLKRAPLQGGAVEPLFSLTTNDEVALDDQRVFWREPLNHALWRRSFDGGLPERIIFDDRGTRGDLRILGGYLYWIACRRRPE